MRVACGGLVHESNTFCPTPTDLGRFQDRHLLREQAMLTAFREAHHEVGGFAAAAEARGLTLVPTLFAGADPAGAVTAAAFEALADELVDRLAGAAADGIYLALHGAMVAEGAPDAEGELLARVRERLGAVPLVASCDWHANVSERMVANCDALVVYQTYPHLDQRQRGELAAHLLAEAVSGRTRPVTAVSRPPLILNLIAQETGVEPMAGLLAQARAVAQRPGILAVSLAGGFPYADIEAMGTTATVVADGDPALAAATARELGEALWAMREAGTPCLPDAAEAVRRALSPGPTPVVLVDFGDNVGGGSAADGPLLLRELLDQGATGAVVTLHAPAAAQQCAAAGIGAVVTLAVGGTCPDGQGPPVTISGQVRSLHRGDYVEPAPRHGGARFLDQGLTAVVSLPGDHLVVLTSLRVSPNSLNQLRSLGIEPTARRVLVVKAAIAYKAAYAEVAGRVIEVDTPGYTAVDPRRFVYQHRRRPLLPFEAVDRPWT